MIRHRWLRWTALALAIVLLLFLAWTGVSGGIEEWPQATTRGQYVQVSFQFIYGLLALVSAVTTFRARQWNRAALGAWAASIAVAGGLASVAWGRSSILVGCVAGGASLLVAVGIAAMLRSGARVLHGGDPNATR